LVNSRHKLALKYNDVSVLENMHAAYTLKLLNDPSNNFLANIDEDDALLVR
jgi:hypothetical protein